MAWPCFHLLALALLPLLSCACSSNDRGSADDGSGAGTSGGGGSGAGGGGSGGSSGEALVYSISVVNESIPNLPWALDFEAPIWLSHCRSTDWASGSLTVLDTLAAHGPIETILRAEYESTTTFSGGGDNVLTVVQGMGHAVADGVPWLDEVSVNTPVRFPRALDRTQALYQVDASSATPITLLDPTANYDPGLSTVVVTYEMADLAGQNYSITETHTLRSVRAPVVTQSNPGCF